MKYFYFWGELFLVPFIIYFYLKNDKSVRIKMLLASVSFGLFALVLDYLFFDYWKPEYIFNNIHLESFLYGFLFGGTNAGITDSITSKKLSGKYRLDLKLTFSFILILIGSFLLLNVLFKINSIYTMSFIPLIVGIISAIKVKGKVKEILLTSFVSVAITLFMYVMILFINPNVIRDYFVLQNTSNIFFLNIPIEELLFAFCLGVGVTYTYEALFNLKRIQK